MVESPTRMAGQDSSEKQGWQARGRTDYDTLAGDLEGGENSRQTAFPVIDRLAQVIHPLQPPTFQSLSVLQPPMGV